MVNQTLALFVESLSLTTNLVGLLIALYHILLTERNHRNTHASLKNVYENTSSIRRDYLGPTNKNYNSTDSS